MDPISLKKRFAVILQEFFRQDKDFPYKDDQAATGIVVADIYGIDRESVEQYPLIAIERLEMAVERAGVGSVGAWTQLKTKAPAPVTSFGNLVQAGLIFHCLSVNGLESEKIATKVANFLEMSRDDIKNLIRLVRLDNVKMSKERRLDRWPDHVDSAVSIGVIYPSTWCITDNDIVMSNAKGILDTVFGPSQNTSP